MDEKHWANVSSEGKDLIQKMLEKDPEKRIKLAEAFNHPWVRNRKMLLEFQGKNRVKA
jgi:serine/threonine protein kinase